MPKGTARPESVVDGIIRRIKLDIRNGGYAPGQRLIEADVQLLTGASRGPVREAMRRLGAEGLLEIHHQKGARVRKLTRTEVENLYDIREVLEGLAAMQAASQHGSPAFRARLKALDESFKQRFDGSPQTYMDYNEQFHAFIVEQSNNPQLARLVTDLQIPIVMMRLFAIIDGTFVKRAYREHQEIAKCLLQGDGERAARAMRRHVRSTKRTVLAKATLLG